MHHSPSMLRRCHHERGEYGDMSKIWRYAPAYRYRKYSVPPMQQHLMAAKARREAKRRAKRSSAICHASVIPQTSSCSQHARCATITPLPSVCRIEKRNRLPYRQCGKARVLRRFLFFSRYAPLDRWRTLRTAAQTTVATMLPPRCRPIAVPVAVDGLFSAMMPNIFILAGMLRNAAVPVCKRRAPERRRCRHAGVCASHVVMFTRKMPPCRGCLLALLAFSNDHPCAMLHYRYGYAMADFGLHAETVRRRWPLIMPGCFFAQKRAGTLLRDSGTASRHIFIERRRDHAGAPHTPRRSDERVLYPRHRCTALCRRRYRRRFRCCALLPVFS